jgi:hypothetical protein
MKFREILRNLPDVARAIYDLVYTESTYHLLAAGHAKNVRNIQHLRAQGFDRIQVRLVQEHHIVPQLVTTLGQKSGPLGKDDKAKLHAVIPQELTRVQAIALGTHALIVEGNAVRFVRKARNKRVKYIKEYLIKFR